MDDFTNYQEHHQNQNEFFPMFSPTGRRKTGFPAAAGVLLTAAGAAALTAAVIVLMAILVVCKPVEIGTDYATMDVTVHNREDTPVYFFVYEREQDMVVDQKLCGDPKNTVIHDELMSDKCELRLENLIPDTEYLILFWTDEEQGYEIVGRCEFRTLPVPEEPIVEPEEPRGGSGGSHGTPIGGEPGENPGGSDEKQPSIPEEPQEPELEQETEPEDETEPEESETETETLPTETSESSSETGTTSPVKTTTKATKKPTTAPATKPTKETQTETESTEPKPTEPKPTEPEPTDPEPTDPEPTEPTSEDSVSVRLNAVESEALAGDVPGVYTFIGQVELESLSDIEVEGQPEKAIVTIVDDTGKAVSGTLEETGTNEYMVRVTGLQLTEKQEYTCSVTLPYTYGSGSTDEESIDIWFQVNSDPQTATATVYESICTANPIPGQYSYDVYVSVAPDDSSYSITTTKAGVLANIDTGDKFYMCSSVETLADNEYRIHFDNIELEAGGLYTCEISVNYTPDDGIVGTAYAYSTVSAPNSSLTVTTSLVSSKVTKEDLASAVLYGLKAEVQVTADGVSDLAVDSGGVTISVETADGTKAGSVTAVSDGNISIAAGGLDLDSGKTYKVSVSIPYSSKSAGESGTATCTFDIEAPEEQVTATLVSSEVAAVSGAAGLQTARFTVDVKQSAGNTLKIDHVACALDDENGVVGHTSTVTATGADSARITITSDAMTLKEGTTYHGTASIYYVKSDGTLGTAACKLTYTGVIGGEISDPPMGSLIESMEAALAEIEETVEEATERATISAQESMEAAEEATEAAEEASTEVLTETSAEESGEAQPETTVDKETPTENQKEKPDGPSVETESVTAIIKSSLKEVHLALEEKILTQPEPVKLAEMEP